MLSHEAEEGRTRVLPILFFLGVRSKSSFVVVSLLSRVDVVIH